jgi:hypothetical protein
MLPQPGYYSLVQYCPDPSRLESVNVGLVLFCPDMAFLDVQLARNDERIRRVFGSEGFRPASLDAAKQALAARLHSPTYRPRTLDEFRRFIDSRGNDLVLTPPRPVKVVQPGEELAQLFHRLVERPRRPRKSRGTLAPELERVLRELVLAGRARRDLTIEVPVLSKSIHVPYAFRNGVLNLVKPQRFSPVETTATHTAMQLAVEGDLIARHGEDAEGKKQLVVVASFADEASEFSVRKRVMGVLGEYPVKTVPPEAVPAFAEEVRREAHA